MRRMGIASWESWEMAVVGLQGEGGTRPAPPWSPPQPPPTPGSIRYRDRCSLSLSMSIDNILVNDKLRARGGGVEEGMAARRTGDGGWLGR